MAATAQGLPPGPRRLARLAAHLGAPGGWGPATACWAPAAGGGGPAVRVGIFGAGGHARRAHAPNLRALPGVEVVAIADANTELAEALAADFCPSARIFADGHEMLEAMELDALFSVVPAFARAAGVEAAAAARGIHLFSEKPQTLDMVLVAPHHPTPPHPTPSPHADHTSHLWGQATANAIADAVKSGVSHQRGCGLARAASTKLPLWAGRGEHRRLPRAIPAAFSGGARLSRRQACRARHFQKL